MPEEARLEPLVTIISRIFNIFVGLAGIAVFVMLIIGGFQYLTSGGDPKKAQAASNTLTYAVLGLVIILASWFILLFVKNFTGIDVTQFTILTP